MKSFRKELWFNIPIRRAFVNITPQVEELLRSVLSKEVLPSSRPSIPSPNRNSIHFKGWSLVPLYYRSSIIHRQLKRALQWRFFYLLKSGFDLTPADPNVEFLPVEFLPMSRQNDNVLFYQFRNVLF